MAKSDDASENGSDEKTFPDPNDMLRLMVSVQRFHQQLFWQMGEVMADMMAMPLGRNRSDRNKPGPLNQAVSDLKDAVDSATDTLQRGGKPD